MKTVLASAGVALALMAGSASASIYQELFPNPNGVDQQQQLRNVGWCGGNAGDPACANRPGDTDPDTDNDGGEGAVSVGTGQDGDAGFAFWSQKGINADGFLFTEEFSFDLTPQTVFTWFQRDSPGGTDDLTRLALRVGS